MPRVSSDHVLLEAWGRAVSQQFIEWPARSIPVVAEADVLVVGGGAAGIAAAVSAARSGADVLLLERYGSVGGMATGGLIILLLTMDDGAGNQMIGGVCQELVDRMELRGATFYPPPEEWGRSDEGLVDRYRRWGLVWGRGPHAATDKRCLPVPWASCVFAGPLGARS